MVPIILEDTVHKQAFSINFLSSVKIISRAVVYDIKIIFGFLTLIPGFVLSTDPAFVGSAFIQESLPKGNAVGDDDKIYFFFSETGKEFDFFETTIVSRIARVCKVRNALLESVFVWGMFTPLAMHHMHRHKQTHTH